MNVQILKKHKIQVITIVLYIATFLYSKNIFMNSISTTVGYLKDMVQILPAVFVISGLITTWVPRETITKYFGKDSGLKGNILSVLLGSISAGPIYAAFPIAFSLFNKGASILNIVLLISTWAVIKVPMLIVESKFLGASFMVTRTLLTIPSIFVIAYITSKIVKRKDIMNSKENLDISNKTIIEIDSILPHFNCSACGYKNCREYAESIVKNGEKHDKCKIGGSKVAKQIHEIVDLTK
ncbi:electron transport complex subunit RsxB [Clostridium tepidiprofundi DSM 19306]|uniref:Electron transport complex subunit RsxB n=1 Tax=Clostridium tepidiprofundi DSM 19306 TaxID=1121338 RepID=A0A151B558_9CLOT|nr:permease [Clostridium tepidiprofundi]KYH35054.1 electron transport complex subunit RsxB [Clostridium tepidiprofundi DSM 19306]